MKTALIFSVIGAMLIMTSSCKDAIEKQFPQKHTTISFISDDTDTGLTQIKPDEIVSLYLMNDDRLYEGFIFRHRAISDAENRPIKQVQVKPVRMLFSDANDRIAELKNFNRQVKDIIEEVGHERIPPKKNSLVYESLCKELNTVVTIHNNSTVIVVTSDLEEHSDNFSFYNKADFRQAEISPQNAAQRLKAIAPMPKATGIKVYFVHRPTSYREQRRYDVAVHVFSLLLKEQGAEVIVTPNILPNE